MPPLPPSVAPAAALVESAQPIQRLTYTLDEVTAALGVSEHIVREWMNRAINPLPVVRSRNRLIFPRDAVREWLMQESGARRQFDNVTRMSGSTRPGGLPGRRPRNS